MARSSPLNPKTAAPVLRLRAKDPRLSAFMQELYSLTTGNPFSRDERVWQDCVAIECSPFEDKIHLSSIRSFAKGKGNASRALSVLCNLADKHGVAIECDAAPFGTKDMSESELTAWYERNGFKWQDGEGLVRQPHMSGETASNPVEASYTRQAAFGKDPWEGKKSPPPDFDLNKVKIRQGLSHQDQEGLFKAFYGSQLVGYAMVSAFADSESPKDERTMWNTSVDPNWQRKGIATKLYDAVEEYLAAKGLKLVPGIGRPLHAVSDDAYELWKRRKPEDATVKADPRWHQQQYRGKPIEFNGETWVIANPPKGKYCFLQKNDGSYRSTSCPAELVYDMYGKPGEPKQAKVAGSNKAVDETGAPLLLWHGTDAEFDTFDDNFPGGGFTAFFTEDKDMARTYGGVLYPANLTINRPAPFDRIMAAARKAGITEQELEDEYPGMILNMHVDVLNYLRAEGYDGWIGEDSSSSDYDMEAMTYVVFSPQQIKKAKSPLLQSKQALQVSETGKRYMQMSGDRLIDEATVGDYELFVVKSGVIPGVHLLGMQRAGDDAFDVNQQMGEKNRNVGRGTRQEFRRVLNAWLEKYGQLVIGSHNPEKTRKYETMLTALGYKVQTGNFRGIFVPYVELAGKTSSTSPKEKMATDLSYIPLYFKSQPRIKEAASYDDMFQPLLVQTPRLKADIQALIQWAKTTLQRSDRILWYLRWARISMARKAKTLAEPEQEQQANALFQKYVKEMATKSGLPTVTVITESEAPKRLQDNLAHFYSLDVVAIESYSPKYESPEALEGKFTEFEEEERSKVEEDDKLILPEDDDTIFIQLADGWAWWLLDRASDEAEACAMGHCGNSPERGNPNIQILSLESRMQGMDFESVAAVRNILLNIQAQYPDSYVIKAVGSSLTPDDEVVEQSYTKWADNYGSYEWLAQAGDGSWYLTLDEERAVEMAREGYTYGHMASPTLKLLPGMFGGDLDELFAKPMPRPKSDNEPQLFPEPQTDAEAERDGIKVSRLLRKKSSDAPNARVDHDDRVLYLDGTESECGISEESIDSAIADNDAQGYEVQFRSPGDDGAEGAYKRMRRKTAFISPRDAELTVMIESGTRSQVTLGIDLGIPNFTQFTLTYPTTGLANAEISVFSRQALKALLDDIAAFMLSMKYNEKQVVEITTLAEECFHEIREEDATDADWMKQDTSIRMYEKSFPLPESFAEETLQKVVTAGTRFRLLQKIALPSQNKIDTMMKTYGLTAEQIQACIATDPSPNQTDFVSWIAKQVSEGTIKLPEDEQKIKSQLTTFTKLKRSPAFTGEKDIQRYTPDTLYDLIEAQGPKPEVSKKQQDRDLLEKGAPGAKLILNTGDYKVFEVTDPALLMVLSSNTNWCTAQEPYAKQYLAKGPNYVFYVKGEPFAQVDPDSDQFMDRKDKSMANPYLKNKVAIDIVTLLRDIKPELYVTYVADPEAAKTTPAGAYKYARNVIQGRWPEGEKAIARDPYWAYEYALDVIKGRFPEAEKTIASDPDWAYKYAYYVIDGRWPEAEAVIASDPQQAYYYALYVIKGRFPEAEKAIARDPKLAYEYARNVIKGLWPEGEKAIARDPYWAYRYALNVIKGRFPEAEAVIASDPYWACNYARDVIKGRWPEAEAAIASDPKWAYKYALNVIRGRWPEAEAVIARDPKLAYDYARDVIKGRWPEAEAAIASDPYWACNYARDVIKGRWPEAEAAIARDPKLAYDYARDVIKGRWPEAEAAIARDPYWAAAYDGFLASIGQSRKKAAKLYETTGSVTAGKVQRTPEVRHLELNAIEVPDTHGNPANVITFYRDQATRNTPHRFEIVVHDSLTSQREEKPRAGDWESKILGKKVPEMSIRA